MRVEPIRILRLFCPPCRKTCSVLPKAISPVCRWEWGDILRVGGRLADESSYSIARSVGESLSSLLHLKSWMVKAGVVVHELARNVGLLEPAESRAVPMDPIQSLSLAFRFSSWEAFTHSFSRAFYPIRFPLLKSHMIPTG